ncbi:MAG TPA: SDR family oxidoreductase [Candidatus Eisenbacteria bacterium]|nr:SDR family oxidoreductase [Candidatus Eisenbacteria bacterium]
MKAGAPIVVVTGVTADLGPAVVRELWSRGAVVHGIYHRAHTRARALAAEAKRRQAAISFDRLDLTRPAASRARARQLSRAWSRVDAFVGLAGYPARRVWREPFETLTPERLEAIYRVDTLGHVWFAQALGKKIARAGGAMVLMCSAAGLVGDDMGVAFALAKAANVALVKSLARLYAPGARVNGLAPGALDTSWLGELAPRERRQARDKALLRRYGKPEEVARVIGELALGPSRFQTGQVLVLDGGVVL